MVDDDEAFFQEMMDKVKTDWQYHEICKWLPYKPETIDEIAQNMAAKGYRQDRPVVVFEGSILDGRHRYEAAIKANVDPIFVEFQGTREEAIDYVTSENVARRHLSNPEKEFFYVQRAEALGVRKREDSLKQNSTVPTNVGSAPTAKEHAEALGVSDRTVERWEDTRKEIKADPKLSEKAKTFEGYKEAKKEVKERKKALSRAEELTLEFNSLTEEEKINRLGGVKPIDAAYQRKLDETLGDDFNPNNAATGILISLNRLRLFGGKKEIENSILGELHRSVRMQKYEAEALLLLADVINEHHDEIASFMEHKPNLKVVN